jgi:hypothetical protein
MKDDKCYADARFKHQYDRTSALCQTCKRSQKEVASKFNKKGRVVCDNELYRLKIVKWTFVIIAVVLAVQLFIRFVMPKYQVNICRDSDCDSFIHENTQIQVRHYEEEDGVIYVYILEKEGN